MNASERYRQRWHLSSSPMFNFVRPILTVGPQSARHDGPCGRCGSAGDCKHREFQPA